MRINQEIDVAEVRLIGVNGEQVGVVSLAEANTLAEEAGVDLVEIAPTAQPPVCRLMDYGKFRYQESKKKHDAKLKQKQVQIKEIKFRPNTDEGDYNIKLRSLINFLNEGDKVKVTLRFRGREMAHTEFGFQVINKFIEDIAPYGHPDFQPKLIGRGINVMISPLPRNKRAKNPRQLEEGETPPKLHSEPKEPKPQAHGAKPVQIHRQKSASSESADGFSNNPFEKL